MIKDILKYSVKNLIHRRTRSALTILSITIGIMAIFTLASFGLGVRFFVEDFSKQMGTDKIMIMPKDYASALGGSNIVFTDKDVDFIKKINGVGEATGMSFDVSKVEFKDYKAKYPYIIGFSTESKEKRLVEEMFGVIELQKGRSLEKGDVLDAVLGYSYSIPNKMFKKAISVGDKVIINNVTANVVGIYQEIGSPQDDAQVYLSLEGFEEIFGTDTYFYLLVRSSVDENPTLLADRIKEKFRKYKNQDKGEEDFFVQTFEQLMETYSAVLNILIGVLVLIALISVVVAAVNTMNTMYAAILERTREIGVMKAIGARNSVILLIFVIEAGIIGLIGGIIGVCIGAVISNIGGHIAASYGLSLLKPIFPLWLIIGCLVFAFLVGALSGVVPAVQASKLNPVDALRYE